MRKAIIIIALVLCSSSVITAQQNTTRVMDEKSGKEILLGPCYRETLLTVDFASDYNSEYSTYQADLTSIAAMKGKAEAYTCTIVLGTWCGDSKEQVPRFLKIADKLEPGFAGIKFICVDRDKKSGSLDITDLNIMKVPTFIIYKDGAETGRIIETPAETLEKDLLKIIK